MKDESGVQMIPYIRMIPEEVENELHTSGLYLHDSNGFVLEVCDEWPITYAYLLELGLEPKNGWIKVAIEGE